MLRTLFFAASSIVGLTSKFNIARTVGVHALKYLIEKLFGRSRDR